MEEDLIPFLSLAVAPRQRGHQDTMWGELMNIFDNKEYKLNPECPCCKGKYANLIAEDKTWKEWVCLDCRKVFIEKDGKIMTRGEA